VAYRGASAPNGCVRSDAKVTCGLGTMDSGDAQVVLIYVVPQDPPRTITNTAAVSSDTADPNTSKQHSLREHRRGGLSRSSATVKKAGIGAAPGQVRRAALLDPCPGSAAPARLRASRFTGSRAGRSTVGPPRGDGTAT
jgi:hypothetical protein